MASYATAIRGTVTVWLQRTVTRAALAVCLLVMVVAFVGLFVVGLQVPGSESGLDRPGSRPSDGQTSSGDAAEDDATTEGEDLGQISTSHVDTTAAGEAGQSSPGDVPSGSPGSTRSPGAPGSLAPDSTAGVDALPTPEPAGGQGDDPPSGNGSTSTSPTQPTTTSPTTPPPTTPPAPPADGGLLGGLLDLLGLG